MPPKKEPKKKKIFYLQEKISQNPQLIREALAGMYYVPTLEISKLPKYIWVRYINARGQYRIGGVLWGNYYPKYLVLLNPKRKYPWRIGIQKNHFYVRDCKAKLREKYEKEKLHELYLDGKLKLDQSALEEDTVDSILEEGRSFEPTDYAPLITTVSKKDYEIQKQLAKEEELQKKTISKSSIKMRTIGTNTSPIPEFQNLESPQIKEIKDKLFELYQDNLLTLNDPDEI